MKIHNLWPTPIYQETASAAQINEWLGLANNLLPEDSKLRNYQDVRPWCTHDLIHEQPEWSSLATWIKEQANQFLDALAIIRKDCRIKSMWVNAQYQQSNHLAHIHPNGIISGILYLQVPQNSQCIRYYDPRPAAGVIDPKRHIVESHVDAAPEVGKLMMWPSWLLHGTYSTTTQQLPEPRISISFNIMIVDEIDTHSSRISLG